MLQVANADRIAFLAASAALRPAPPIDLEAWAVENVVFSSAESVSSMALSICCVKRARSSGESCGVSSALMTFVSVSNTD